VLQITGVAQIPLADADFILDPKSVVPVAVDLIRPERAGLGKFVGGGVGVGGVAKLGKGVGKAGLSGMLQLVALLSNKCWSWCRHTSSKVPLGLCCFFERLLCTWWHLTSKEDSVFWQQHGGQRCAAKNRCLPESMTLQFVALLGH